MHSARSQTTAHWSLPAASYPCPQEHVLPEFRFETFPAHSQSPDVACRAHSNSSPRIPPLWVPNFQKSKPTAHSTKFKGHFSCEVCMGSTTQHPVSAACLSQLKWLFFKLASMKVFLLLNCDYWFMCLFPRRGSKPLTGRKHVLFTVPMYQALDCSRNNRIPIICFVVLHACMCSCMCVLSCVWLFATPGMAAHQAPLFMGFPRQAYWRGLPFPPPGDLSDPGMEPTSPALPLIMILKWNVRLWSTRKYFSLPPVPGTELLKP